MPFFSVIIPVYNRAHRLPKALQSLKEQTFTDFETIIVDDASKDNSFQVAQDFDLPNKIVLRNEKNSERCISRNRGIEVANGKYICFLDSDDYHLPDHFEKLHQFIVGKGEPEAFFFTNSWNGFPDGTLTERVCPDLEEKNIFEYLLRFTPNPQRWAVHRKFFEKINFDPEIPGLEDLDFLLRAATHVPFFHFNERNTVYMQHEESYTQSAERFEKELKYFKYIFSKKELAGKLPRKETNRLLSMCNYHLAAKANEKGNKSGMYKHGFKSFFLYPASYNGSTNKPLFVIMLYGLPLFGPLVKMMVHFFKK